MVNVGNVEPSLVVSTLRQALDAVDKLSIERAGLEEALKVERNKDNLLPKLMANASQTPDALFKEEIKKYEGLKVHPSPMTPMNSRSRWALSLLAV